MRSTECAARQVADPPATRWDECALPDAWPDTISAARFRIFWRILRGLVSRKPPLVELPEDLPGGDRIPKYVLQSFHGLPNGNYSKRVTEGYSRWFDRVMLGVMAQRRRRIVAAMTDCESVLDVGCGAGQLAGMMLDAGVEDVWGLDPSPYLLQHAQRAFPALRLVHGIAEAVPFPAHRFDGVAACFLLHELPPKGIHGMLAECRRILRPGGRLCIVEPDSEQLHGGLVQLFKRHGWRGVYFRALARRVHEPFIEAFHRIDKAAVLREHGFEVISERCDFPTREWLSVIR